jgi:hypothetical protein
MVDSKAEAVRGRVTLTYRMESQEGIRSAKA